MIKATKILHRAVERVFASMAKWRVAQIMRQRDSLGQIIIQPQGAGHRPGNLGDFKRMRQPRAKIVTFMIHKHLCFVFETTERARMDDPVTVALI